MNLDDKKWIDVTDKYRKPHENYKHGGDLCDWGTGCIFKAKFRVTLKDGHKRYLCLGHLEQRLRACEYTHLKVEELEEG